MKWLLDSNTCIRYLRAPLSPVGIRLASTPADEKALSTIVVFELLRGAYRSLRPDENRERVRAFAALYIVLDFDSGVAETAAQIDADLMRRGERIGGNDVLIAATALHNQLILVTHNTREFTQVGGLRLEDWELHEPR